MADSIPSVALIHMLPHNIYWIYFHGKIAQELGYDLVSCDREADLLPLGESEVLLHGTTRILKIFLFEDHIARRGYIVDPDDDEGIYHGRKLLKTKPTVL